MRVKKKRSVVSEKVDGVGVGSHNLHNINGLIIIIIILIDQRRNQCL
jgi:hypothetical protein